MSEATSRGDALLMGQLNSLEGANTLSRGKMYQKERRVALGRVISLNPFLTISCRIWRQ